MVKDTVLVDMKWSVVQDPSTATWSENSPSCISVPFCGVRSAHSHLLASTHHHGNREMDKFCRPKLARILPTMCAIVVHSFSLCAVGHAVVAGAKLSPGSLQGAVVSMQSF